MLFNLLFALCLAAAVGLSMYLTVNEKMQAKPWLFLVPALVALLTGFLLQTSYDTLASLLVKLQPGKDPLAEIKLSLPLVNNVIGGFSGALIGAAVTIRASRLHSRKVRELEQQVRDRERLVQRLVEIREDLGSTNCSLPEQEREAKHQQATTALTSVIWELQELKREHREFTSQHFI